jgi:hypothetical protein
LGLTDLSTSQALERAWNLKAERIRKLFDAGRIHPFTQMPNMLVVHVAMLTRDDHLVIGRRSLDTPFAPSLLSASFEKQFDPIRDTDAHQTVERGIYVEFGFHPDPRDDIRLVAFGREWGQYWNTAALFVVRLTASSDDVRRAYGQLGKPRSQACLLFPVDTVDRRANLLQLISGRAGPDVFGEVGAKSMPGALDPTTPWHPTTTWARVLFALAYRIGSRALCDEIARYTGGPAPEVLNGRDVSPALTAEPGRTHISHAVANTSAHLGTVGVADGTILADPAAFKRGNWIGPVTKTELRDCLKLSKRKLDTFLEVLQIGLKRANRQLFICLDDIPNDDYRHALRARFKPASP